MERAAIDTTFLIDLQNDRRARAKESGATEFLRSHRDLELFLPVVALGEYLEGFDDPRAADARHLVSGLSVLSVEGDVAAIYATTARRLRAQGKLIGSNDLWIACIARAARLPLLTRNVAEFSRVPQLEVIDYRTR